LWDIVGDDIYKKIATYSEKALYAKNMITDRDISRKAVELADKYSGNLNRNAVRDSFYECMSLITSDNVKDKTELIKSCLSIMVDEKYTSDLIIMRLSYLMNSIRYIALYNYQLAKQYILKLDEISTRIKQTIRRLKQCLKITYTLFKRSGKLTQTQLFLAGFDDFVKK